MATYYRVVKTPTVFEQTDTELRPITSTAGFSDWGNVKDISAEEMSGLQSRYNMGAPIGADYIKPMGTQDTYKYSPTGLQKISPAGVNMLGGSVGEVGADVLGLYKQGQPINDYEIPPVIKSALESKYSVPAEQQQKQGLMSTLVNKAKSFATNLTGQRTEAMKSVAPYQKELDEIGVQIAEKEGEYEKGMQTIEGKPIPMEAIAGEQSQLTKLANIELKTLYAKQAALTGNYNRAYTLATDAYESWKESETAEMAALQTELDYAKENLSDTEKKVAEEYQLALDQYKSDLAREEKLQDQKIALSLQFITAGITPADSWEQAMAKASVVASKKEKLELQMLQEQINTERAQQAKILADTDKIITEGLKSTSGSELKTTALSSAKQLQTMFRLRQGTTAVGRSNFLGTVIDFITPGGKRADFVTNYDNLKALLSLENVKYLKGQGQISDAERLLLEQASSQLSRNQSEAQFQATLQDIINVLGGVSVGQSVAGGSSFTTPGGKTLQLPN